MIMTVGTSKSEGAPTFLRNGFNREKGGKEAAVKEYEGLIIFLERGEEKTEMERFGRRRMMDSIVVEGWKKGRG